MILGQIRRDLGYEGFAFDRKRPDADSPNAKFVYLRFWKGDVQVEIPLEITRIVCLDRPIIRTASGTVYATASDRDLVESKIVAVLNRVFLQYRDLVDVFLYGDKLQPDSPARLKKKLAKLKLSPEAIARRLKDLEENSKYHAAAIQKVIDEQAETTLAQQMNTGGGGRTILDSALHLITRLCSP